MEDVGNFPTSAVRVVPIAVHQTNSACSVGHIGGSELPTVASLVFQSTTQH